MAYNLSPEDLSSTLTYDKESEEAAVMLLDHTTEALAELREILTEWRIAV